MMVRASAAKRAEEFAAALEGRDPTSVASAETLAFVAIVEQLRDLESPAMRPEFAASLRERLMAAAPAELAKLRTGPTATRRSTSRSHAAPEPRHRRIIRIVAATCVVIGTGSGVAAASQSALPGDPLYQVKRSIERVEVATAGSSADRGDALLNQAETRLSEVQSLAIAHPDDPAVSSLMSETLQAFESQAGDGANSLVSAYESDDAGQNIVRLRDFADESTTQLEALGGIVPTSVQDEVVAAAEALTAIDADARDACAGCSSLVPLQLTNALVQLQQTTQDLLGNLGNSGSRQPGTAAGPITGGTQGAPTGQLPTLPVITPPAGGGGDDDPTLPAVTTNATGGSKPSTGQSPQKPGLTLLPTQIAVPSIPGVPLPTIVLPLPAIDLLDPLGSIPSVLELPERLLGQPTG